MNRKIVVVSAAAVPIAAIGLTSTAIGQVPASGVSAAYCMSDQGFEFEIDAIVTVEDDPVWGYIEVIPVNVGTEYFRVDYDLSGGNLTVTGAPTVNSSAAPDNLQDGAFSYSINGTLINDGAT